MGLPAFKLDRESIEAPQSAKSNVLHLVLERNQMSQMRHEIGMIADRSYHDNLISDEAYAGYRELAEKREGHEIGAEMLESTREFAKKHEEKAIRVHKKIQSAIGQKYASKTDEEFLMEKLVANNMNFAEQSGEVESQIDQKLARMKADKEKYDKLANHDLIKDIGYLKVDGNTRIDFPNAEEFLKLTVPERREFLKKLEEALPKAEKYAKEHESEEDKELTIGYESKLKSALKKGIIGKHTYDEFLNGFKKVDHEEKKHWNGEFDAQMKRYETLWGQIRGSLEGEALKSIEDKIDNSGYTELFTEFGRLKDSESERLGEEYAQNLEKYREDGIIGRHTIAEFTMWMNQQELSDKYKAEQKLPDQMARYEELWQKAEDLPEKQQDFMRSKIDDWGYTELNQQYNKYTGAEGVQTEGADQNSLSQLKSTEVKEAILETDEMLAGQGGGKRKSFIKILSKMYSRVSRDSFDASSFETGLRSKAANDNGKELTKKGRGADDEVDRRQIEKDTKTLEESGEVKVTKDLGFIQVESAANDNNTAHKIETQVTINEDRGMERLLSEEASRGYRAENDGGNDDLSLAIKSKSGRTELDLQEIRVLHKHMEAQEEEDRLDKEA